MKINFKVLSTFLAVAENASFRKAAEQTHLSLPAVSMQIKQLEERLGVALFQRTTRKVELTREGEELMISTRKAMAELDASLARIQKAAEAQQGHLSFACVPTIAGTRLPALLVEFARRYPGISVRVRELAQPDLLEAVRRRDVDFGIGPAPDRPGELDAQALFDDDYVALVPAAHPAAAKAGITLRELAKLPLLTLGASQFERHLLTALREEDLAPELHYEFTHVSTMVAMAEAGLGVGVMPAVAVPPGTALKAVRIVRPVMTRTIAIITIRGHTLSPSAARFVDMCGVLAPPRAKKGT
ncbi:LysR family transcriptional regulator [Ramlibacter sp. G-1-2-2]|uniref:LysR family transcriptional regulator n=1 Tax=Ramlibacter agri TaxID=2728837 RepID=A0A848H187_9BURK|nr:LysR family transcriptional regulator [Ramlibacter agri]NML43361.1 LysR family transcriptional regulator [Ramlibacter agri]